MLKDTIVGSAPPERSLHSVVARLTAAGDHVTLVSQTTDTATFKAGSKMMSVAFGALVGGEKWPVDITVNVQPNGAGTAANVTVTAAHSVYAGVVGLAMNKGGKAEALWMGRIKEALEQAGPAPLATAPTGAAAIAPRAPGSPPGARCGACGEAVDGEARFCVACGQPVVRVAACPSCGAEVSPSARFCATCGTTLTSPAAAAKTAAAKTATAGAPAAGKRAAAAKTAGNKAAGNKAAGAPTAGNKAAVGNKAAGNKAAPSTQAAAKKAAASTQAAAKAPPAAAVPAS